MKKVQIGRFGRPEEVAECVECPEVGEPAADEVVFEVLAFPINPADIAFCEGRYRLKPPLPATPGAEGVGRVISAGESVTGVKAGDLVTNLDRENWAQQPSGQGGSCDRAPARHERTSGCDDSDQSSDRNAASGRPRGRSRTKRLDHPERGEFLSRQARDLVRERTWSSYRERRTRRAGCI
jgi:hypothetical protein